MRLALLSLAFHLHPTCTYTGGIIFDEEVRGIIFDEKVKGDRTIKKLCFMCYKEIIKGSSETIRETTFNFYLYKKNLVSHKKSLNPQFLEWFVGFSEGDGSFIVSQSRLFFIINQKEERVLQHIRSNLGFGKVSHYNDYYRYIVADKQNIDRLINLFNGNLVLQKTNNRFLSWLHTRNSGSPEVIEYLGPNTKIEINKNAWFSGFIDSEGCFNVLKQNDQRYSLGWRVRLRFLISQKNERAILEKIKLFLKSGSVTERKDVANMYVFTSYSLSGHTILIDYRSRHKLRSQKRISFVRWVRLKGYIETRKVQPWKNKILKRVERLIYNDNKGDIEEVKKEH